MWMAFSISLWPAWFCFINLNHTLNHLFLHHSTNLSMKERQRSSGIFVSHQQSSMIMPEQLSLHMAVAIYSTCIINLSHVPVNHISIIITKQKKMIFHSFHHHLSTFITIITWAEVCLMCTHSRHTICFHKYQFMCGKYHMQTFCFFTQRTAHNPEPVPFANEDFIIISWKS